MQYTVEDGAKRMNHTHTLSKGRTEETHYGGWVNDGYPNWHSLVSSTFPITHGFCMLILRCIVLSLCISGVCSISLLPIDFATLTPIHHVPLCYQWFGVSFSCQFRGSKFNDFLIFWKQDLSNDVIKDQSSYLRDKTICFPILAIAHGHSIWKVSF